MYSRKMGVHFTLFIIFQIPITLRFKMYSVNLTPVSDQNGEIVIRNGNRNRI